MVDTTKRCPDCGIAKPLEEFFANRATASGRQAYCKPCWMERTRQYNRRNPDEYRARHRAFARKRLAARHGLTVEEMDRRIADQDHVCAICRRPETRVRGGRTTLLALDHDHATGAARGFLCTQCNRGLGLFADNPDSLRRAIRYLSKYAA